MRIPEATIPARPSSAGNKLSISNQQGVAFLQWALPRAQFRWLGFRKVRRQILRRIGRRLSQLGLSDLDAYREHLERHPAEWTVFDSFCRISISRFYRDRDVFDCLVDYVLPDLAGRAFGSEEHAVRCWSVGCASGEEPYTLAIAWRLALAAEYPGTSMQVVATDADPHMLRRAREAVYPPSSLKDLPENWRLEAFKKVEHGFELKQSFRGLVQRLEQDVRQNSPAGRPFDLILCRHLAFTYFDQPQQEQVLRRLLAALRPEGYLVTAKKESLPGDGAGLKPVYPRLGIYRKPEKITNR